MPEKVDLNVSPYYDDYDEDKKYHKVLYRASRPIQARELTQAQSILQNQIERFGDHMFKEGSIVTGAESNVDMDVRYIKVESSNPNSSGTVGVENYRTSFDEKYLKGKTSGVVAQVVTSYAESTSDPITYIVRYYKSGSDAVNSQSFIAGEELEEVTISSTGATTSTGSNNDLQIQAATKTPIGRASIAEIQEGVIFTRGFFVKVNKQLILLEKYSGAPSYRVGLEIAETLVGSASDSTLFDNAQGSSNENATGADRLKVELTLAKHLIDATTDSNFVELMRVNNGIMELSIQRPIYNAFQSLLARRTFDTSGDFVVRQFLPTLKEHLDDGTNGGVYSTLNGGKEDKFVIKSSRGKAYVKGYEVDKPVGTTIPILKARTTASLTSASTAVRMGNFVTVKNSHGLPEFGNETGSDAQAPYNIVKLYDAVTASAGAENSSGHIGYARIRNFDMATAGTSNSDEVWDNATTFNAYLFDIKMFTKLKYSSHGGAASVGDRLVGSISGATGIIVYDNGSDAIYLQDVVGEFTSSDVISSTEGTFGLTANQNTGENYRGTAGEIRTYSIDRVRSLSQSPETSGRAIFTADVDTDQDNTLTGSVSMASTNVTGFATKFTAELKEGDIVIDGGGNERIISSVTSDTAAVLTASVGTAMDNANATRRRTRIKEQDQTAAIYAWPRDWVKTHTPDQVQVRRSQNITLTSQTLTITKGSAESFSARTNDNYVFSVVEPQTSGSPTFSDGDMIDVVNNLSGSPYTESISGNNLTFSGFPAADNDAIIKVTYTVDINTPVNRDKNLHQSRCLSVVNSRATGGFYGTCYNDPTITLGVADIYKVRAIYEGNGSTAPKPPSGTLTETASPAVAFQNFEVIKGNTSDARAVIINYNGSTNKSYFYYVSDNKTFIEGEVIVGQTSQAPGTITSVDVGATNITDRYYLDDGQRDGFYDHGSLKRKSGVPAPSAQILVLFDYFTASGNGDFFDIESYTSAGVEYKDVPKYIPTKVDLGGLEPDGQFELSDAVDFRPIIGQLLGTATFSSGTPDPDSPINLSNTTSGCVSAPLAYASKSFKSAVTGISATGASAVDVPVDGSNVIGDISFYVGRIDKVFLHKDGEFQVSRGNPAITPMKPKAIDDAIEMFEVIIPPYTADLKKVKLKSIDHRRYTMKDIGKIQNRVANLERLTTLSLLERDTQTMQFQDGDGLDRFKSGFVVDSFKGHGIGDVSHPDYNCSVDAKNGQLRPMNFQNFFDIEFDSVTSSNYQKTGDLITLPYTTTSYVNQSKASRAINVNPYHVFAFIGAVDLSPATDIWQDQTQLPEVRINREGNFDALVAESNDLGTVWNSWQTTWVGEPVTTGSEVVSSSSGSWSGDPAQGGTWEPGTEVTREITETPETQTRSGIRTNVVEDFVESRNDRVVSVSVIPWIRAQNITIDAVNLKPDTFHYVFFDQENVNKFVRPHSADYSQDGGTTVASGIKTDGNGRLRAVFELPNSGTDRFATGQRELKLTSSFFNESNPTSGGSTEFSAQGLLQTNQTEITSTRNGRTVIQAASGSREIARRGEIMNSENVDEDPPPVDNGEDPGATEPPTNTSGGGDNSNTNFPIEGADIQLPLDLDLDLTLWDFNFMGWFDPLAQSFLVDKTGGMFITEIDVYFKTKDESLPVSVEIRNMVNGYPGQIILPFSQVSKNPADVNTSQDGSVATTFTLPSPVFVEENQEYCFVVLSNSNKYEAFISRMGETDLVTAQTISGQPYAGSLFMSQNASTWTAEQTDDLKFHLKYARFDTTKIPAINFNNKALPVAELQNNPIESFSGQNYVRIYSYGHGMYDTSSNAVIAGATGDATGGVINLEAEGNMTAGGSLPANGTYSNLATTSSGTGTGCTVDITIASSAVSSVKISNPGFGYKAVDTITVTNYGSATNTLQIDIDTVDDLIGGIPVSCINGTYTAVANIDIDSYTVIPDLSSTDLKSGYVALSSTQSGGNSVTAQRNYYFDAIHTMIPSVQLKGTQMNANVKVTAMPSPEGVGGTAYNKTSTSEFITLNDNHFLGQPAIVASPINETNEMSSVKSFTAQIQMYSPRRNLSPVIDVSSIGALGIMNRINNIDSSSDIPTGLTYVDSTEPDGDNNAFVYITKRVSLATPGTAIKVMLDGFKPNNTELKVMYKTLENDNSTPFDDTSWTYFNTTGAPDVAVQTDSRNFKEHNYTAEGLAEFSAFAIKIVGQSTSTSIIPVVSNLRAIALAT